MMMRCVAAMSLFIVLCVEMVPGCAVEAVDSPDLGDGVGTKAPGGTSTNDETVGEAAEALNACNPCYVRCTNAAPTACKWTSAHNIGKQNDCTDAGKAWCSNHGYAHSWAGCSSSLHYGNCS